MSKKQGIIVSFIRVSASSENILKDGIINVEAKTTKAIAYHEDQRIVGKLLLYIIDDNFKPTGENVVKKQSDCTLIGFVD